MSIHCPKCEEDMNPHPSAGGWHCAACEVSLPFPDPSFLDPDFAGGGLLVWPGDEDVSKGKSADL